MPEGMHWEWRGFGRISPEFRAAFEQRPRKFQAGPEWDETRDEHLFVPNCPINVKLRFGRSQQGLKLKRFAGREGGLELWTEDPKELYPFQDIDAAVLTRLADALGVSLGEPVRAGQRSAEVILDHLRNATPRASVVTVWKRRQTRKASRSVQVELTEIARVTADGRDVALHPPLFSVGVENGEDLTGRPVAALAGAANEVHRALADLGLLSEALRTLNYLEAIDTWSRLASRPEAEAQRRRREEGGFEGAVRP